MGREKLKNLLEFVVFSKASTNILLVLLPSMFNNYEENETRKNRGSQ